MIAGAFDTRSGRVPAGAYPDGWALYGTSTTERLSTATHPAPPGGMGLQVSTADNTRSDIVSLSREGKFLASLATSSKSCQASAAAETDRDSCAQGARRGRGYELAVFPLPLIPLDKDGDGRLDEGELRVKLTPSAHGA